MGIFSSSFVDVVWQTQLVGSLGVTKFWYSKQVCLLLSGECRPSDVSFSASTTTTTTFHSRYFFLRVFSFFLCLLFEIDLVMDTSCHPTHLFFCLLSSFFFLRHSLCCSFSAGLTELIYVWKVNFFFHARPCIGISSFCVPS